MAANLDRSWLSLREIRSGNAEFFVTCRGRRDGRELPAHRRRGEADARPSDARSRDLDDRRCRGAHYERDDLDNVAGLIGSVASRMSRYSSTSFINRSSSLAKK